MNIHVHVPPDHNQRTTFKFQQRPICKTNPVKGNLEIHVINQFHEQELSKTVLESPLQTPLTNAYDVQWPYHFSKADDGPEFNRVNLQSSFFFIFTHMFV